MVGMLSRFWSQVRLDPDGKILVRTLTSSLEMAQKRPLALSTSRGREILGQSHGPKLPADQ
jgi:hypothetical protein